MLFLTTHYTGHEYQQRERRLPTSTQPRSRAIKEFFGNEVVKEVPVPSVAADYNDLMNAVDIGDHLRSSLGFEHRICRGGWQALAWTFLLDIVLINSYILQLRGEPIWPRLASQVQWRQQLVDQLCEAYGKSGGSRQRFRAGDEFTPVSQHNHVNRGKCSRCLACQGHRVGQPRSQSSQKPLGPLSNDALNRRRAAPQTRWGCDVCNVALCNSKSCWDFYHSVV